MGTYAKKEKLPGGFLFILPVWGDKYVCLFLDYCLPGLLTDGNLKAFAHDANSVFSIYTSRKNLGTIKTNRYFRELSLLMTTKLIADPMFEGQTCDSADDKKDGGVQSVVAKCRNMAIADEMRSDIAFVFLTPTTIFSDGSLAHLRMAALAGKRVVGIPLIHVKKDSFADVLRDRFCDDEGHMPAPARELTALAIQHLHQRTHNYFITSNAFPVTPKAIFWPVENEGLLCRCADFYPLMIFPADKSAMIANSVNNRHYIEGVPDIKDYYFVEDSDEIVGFNILPKHKLPEPARHSIFTTPVYADQLKQSFYSSKTARRIYCASLLKKIRIHSGDLSEAWVEPEKQSDKTIRMILGSAGLIGKYGDKSELVLMENVARVAVFGTGEGGRYAATFLLRNLIEITYFIDNNPARWGSTVMGYEVKGPKALKTYDADMIVVASTQGKDRMFEQLDNMGFVYKINYLFFLDLFAHNSKWGVRLDAGLKVSQHFISRGSISCKIAFEDLRIVECELLELSSVQCSARIPITQSAMLHIHKSLTLIIDPGQYGLDHGPIHFTAKVSRWERDTQNAPDDKFSMVLMRFTNIDMHDDKNFALLLSHIG